MTRASTTWSGYGQMLMFEVLNGKSVGCYNTEQEAENVAENIGVQYPEPKEPNPDHSISMM